MFLKAKMKKRRPRLIEDRDGFTREETEEEREWRKSYWGGATAGVITTLLFFPHQWRYILYWLIIYLLLSIVIRSISERFS